jgi:hypothetical protein
LSELLLLPQPIREVVGVVSDPRHDRYRCGRDVRGQHQ